MVEGDSEAVKKPRAKQRDETKGLVIATSEPLEKILRGKKTPEELHKLVEQEFGQISAGLVGLSKMKKGSKELATAEDALNEKIVVTGKILATAVEHNMMTTTLQNNVIRSWQGVMKEVDQTNKQLYGEDFVSRKVKVEGFSSKIHDYLDAPDKTRNDVARELHKEHKDAHPDYAMNEKDFIEHLERYRPILLEMRAMAADQPALRTRGSGVEVSLVEKEEGQKVKAQDKQLKKVTAVPQIEKTTVTVPESKLKPVDWTAYDDKSKTQFNLDLPKYNGTSYKDRLLYTTWFLPIIAGDTSKKEKAVGAAALAIGYAGGTEGLVLSSALQATGHLRRKGDQVKREVEKGAITNEIWEDLKITESRLNTLAGQTAYTIDKDSKENYEKTALAIHRFIQEGKIPSSVLGLLATEKGWYLKMVQDQTKTLKGMNGALNDRMFDYHIHAEIAGAGLMTGRTDNELGRLTDFTKKADKAKEKMEDLEGHREHVSRGPEKFAKDAQKAADRLSDLDVAVDVQAKTLMVEYLMVQMRRKMIEIEKNAANPEEARKQMVTAIMNFP